MQNYHTLLADIVANGIDMPDRTGTGVRSVFLRTLRFDLREGFPLLTTKHVSFKNIATELLFFLRGATDNHWLLDHNNTIWSPWSDEQGQLGPIYGCQWRRWNAENLWDSQSGDDQIAQVIENLKSNPFSRRHVVSAWNVSSLPDERVSPQDNVAMGKMCLAPCHYTFQFYVTPGSPNKLSCLFNMRSTDALIGLPYNIASYALLTHMIAQQVEMEPYELAYSGANVHIYRNHFEQVDELLSRDPLAYPLPTLELERAPNIDGYTLEHMKIVGYKSFPAIKAPIAV